MTPLLVLPLQDAGTRPAGTFGWEVNGGVSLVSVDLPVLPVFPALTGGAAVEWGLTDAVDVGARYTTWLGYDHRLGPEVQLGRTVGPWSVGARAHPWVRLAGAAQRGLAYGGDLSTQAAAVATYRTDALAVTAELGATVQWVLFERLDGVGFADPHPWVATGDVALELAWADPWARALAVRFELGIPRAPDDPIVVLGVRPRLVIAGHFGSR